jgi:peptide/nickel transport system substrate-binding protein
MQKRFCLTARIRATLVAGASLVIAAGTAEAQRQGGSITLGTELDIPGLDPVKVGAFDARPYCNFLFLGVPNC